MLAATNAALSVFARRSRLKSTIVKPPKMMSPAMAYMTLPAGIETKIATIPNTIRPSRAQNSGRSHAERSLRVAYPYVPTAATNAAVAPAACQRADGSASA
jgi:hypothetical protein